MPLIFTYLIHLKTRILFLRKRHVTNDDHCTINMWYASLSIFRPSAQHRTTCKYILQNSSYECSMVPFLARRRVASGGVTSSHVSSAASDTAAPALTCRCHGDRWRWPCVRSVPWCCGSGHSFAPCCARTTDLKDKILPYVQNYRTHTSTCTSTCRYYEVQIVMNTAFESSRLNVIIPSTFWL